MAAACKMYDISVRAASPAISEVDVDGLYLSGSVLFLMSENKREGVRVRSQRVTERERESREEDYKSLQRFISISLD